MSPEPPERVEYRIHLDFRPRWQLLAALADAVTAYDVETGGCGDVLVAGDLHGGVSLIVRSPAQDPSVVPAADGRDRPEGQPPTRPRSSRRDGGGRRRTASAPAPTDRPTGDRAGPGALSARLEELLVVLHRDFDDVALDPAGRVAGKIAAAAGWTPKQTSNVLGRAASIGLVRRVLRGKRCSEVALTPVGLAALDRLDPGTDVVAPVEPGGGAVDAPVVDRFAVSEDPWQRRRDAAAAAI